MSIGKHGVWMARGSRQETKEQAGIAHFVEHMLSRARDAIASGRTSPRRSMIGGQMTPSPPG